MKFLTHLVTKLVNKSCIKHLQISRARMSTEVASTVCGVPVEKRELEQDEVQEAKKLKTSEENLVVSQVQTKKRKYALLIGYSGQGYFGLQRNATNKEHRTIEDEIVDALVKVGSIPQQHADEMFKMSFNRAARTDKGVSAVANLLSLKMEMRDDTLVRLNELLPKQIRVFGYRKTTQSFDCKTNCDARTYKYVLPTFALCAIEENTIESYRVTREVLNEMNSILKMYHGTHNYHNFTSGKKFIDPSAKRYIMSMECSEPFMRDNVEFIVITVKGQSFMLHQIRKMIGLAIAVCRGVANKKTIELCWTTDKVDMPIAPALGLLLDQLHYDRYNKKFGKDGLHEALLWPELQNEIENFTHEYIYSNIIKREIEEKSMWEWLARLCNFSYDKIQTNYPTGACNGIGRAAYKISEKNNTKNDDDAESDVDE